MRRLTRSRRRLIAALGVAMVAPALGGRSWAASPSLDPSVDGALDATKRPPRAQQLRISSALGPALPEGAAAAAWTRGIAARGDMGLAARHHPGASLVARDAARELAGLRDGAAELAVGSAMAWAREVPALAVFALPWLVVSFGRLAILLAGETTGLLDARLQQAGVVPLAWAAGQFRELATTAAVAGPDELRGRTLRAPDASIVQETLEALGAIPASLGAAQASLHFADGGLEGDVTTLAAYASARGYALGLRHLTLWHAHADALVFAANRSAWDGLGDARQQAVRAAAVEAAAEATRAIEAAATREALARLAADGASIVPLSDAGVAAFRLRSAQVAARWRERVGEDLALAAGRDLERGARG